MSYMEVLPEKLEIYADYERVLHLSFICPRCEEETDIEFEYPGLTLDTFMTVECQSVRCCDRSKGQRVGYSFEFTLRRGIECASMLGLNDRPLNE